MAEQKRKGPARPEGSKKPGAQPQETGKKKAITAAESVGFLVIVAVVLVLANVAATFLPGRIDLTENRVYSLSQGSERLVANLEDRMEITAYFTEDLPPPFNQTEQYVRNLLSEYEAASNGKLAIRFVNPDTDEQREQAEEDGVRLVPHRVIGEDSVNVREGYRGLVIRYLGQRETIPMISETRGLEYAISQAIRRLVREPMAVGVVSGHGSPALTKGLGNLRAALPQYELREVNAGEEIDGELRAVLIVDAGEEFSETELRRINQYVMRGGSLGVFSGAFDVELGPTWNGNRVDSNLNDLLSKWGIRIGNSLVMDANSERAPYRHPIGVQIPVQYPPFVIATLDEEQQTHPATFRLGSAPFFFSSPIQVTDVFRNLHGKILARSSPEQSWLITGESLELTPKPPEEWLPIEGRLGPHNLFVALEGRLPTGFEDSAEGIEAPARSEREVQVLVSGTGWMLRDELIPTQEMLQQQQGQMGASLALALNSIDWLTQDQDLIAIRAKNIEDPMIDVPHSVTQARESALDEANRARAEVENEQQLEEARERIEAAVQRFNEAQEEWDTRKDLYRWGITLGIPFLITILGIFWFAARRSRRPDLAKLRAHAKLDDPGGGGWPFAIGGTLIVLGAPLVILALVQAITGEFKLIGSLVGVLLVLVGALLTRIRRRRTAAR